MSTSSLGSDRSINDSLHAARNAIDALLRDEALLTRASEVPGLIARSLAAGGKVMAIGNGGSNADAAHFAEELTGRFRLDRPALAAMACTDAGHITCTANDYGYDFVFSRWVEALGRKGDVLIAISTSGSSINVLKAVQSAHQRGMIVVGLLGKTGGKLKELCDVELIVPGDGTDRIQELHMLLLHAWVERVEGLLFPGGEVASH
jgi:D-sedoheptulose 7-phosphate isomerase